MGSKTYIKNFVCGNCKTSNFCRPLRYSGIICDRCGAKREDLHDEFVLAPGSRPGETIAEYDARTGKWFVPLALEPVPETDEETRARLKPYSVRSFWHSVRLPFERLFGWCSRHETIAGIAIFIVLEIGILAMFAYSMRGRIDP